MRDRDVCRSLRDGLRDQQWVGSHEELLRWLDGLTGVQQCVADALRESLEDEDLGTFERYVLAAHRKPSRLYTATLCEALGRRYVNLNNEDVVEALGAIADPASIGCLEDVLEWEPPWDEYRQLGVKCVWALSAINNDQARQVLRRVAGESRSPEIRKAAARKLDVLSAHSD